MALSKIRNDSLADTAVHGRRNIIINGAMQVAQRGTSTSGKTGGVSFNSCDRMSFSISSCGTWTVSQDSNAPDGFANSYKVLCTTAKASLAASNYVIPLNYVIEGQDLQQLAFGTSSAKKMIMSFWVKSNKTGSGSVEFLQQDNSGKLFTGTYTINSADTWEYKTITIPADTAGVINDDNGNGVQLQFWGNSGSNFTGGSAGSTWATISNPNRNPNNLGIGGAVNDYWQITGLQLEVGNTATPFEHRSYGEELRLSQRYFYQVPSTHFVGTVGSSYNNLTNTAFAYHARVPIPVSMRANPTVTLISAAVSATDVSSKLQYSSSNTDFIWMRVQTAFSTPTGDLAVKYSADAELT